MTTLDFRINLFLDCAGREWFKKKKKKVSKQLIGMHCSLGQSSKRAEHLDTSMAMCRAVPNEGLMLEPFPEHSLILQCFQNQHSELGALSVVQGSPRA